MLILMLGSLMLVFVSVLCVLQFITVCVLLIMVILILIFIFQLFMLELIAICVLLLSIIEHAGLLNILLISSNVLITVDRIRVESLTLGHGGEHGVQEQLVVGDEPNLCNASVRFLLTV